jgi:hypothetical protein
MAGKVLNIKILSPLKQHSGLTGNHPQSLTALTLNRCRNRCPGIVQA